MDGYLICCKVQTEADLVQAFNEYQLWCPVENIWRGWTEEAN